ncbi:MULTISPECIES: ABC transporter permease [unclassified Pseudofrankia]|uniref:ABC transporter permease n=1 Tax=unclassified Pseudofrankia TaxID=2994372 RepID=UPI0008D96D39|nr:MULTISPECIES: ABC transporter permease [unclassified Pseudofrankia]MDT3438210.1 ABC transporter permease [Pseudofrankia sp. BMG5.37]OHV46706.1 nitrate ABC transporter permease [Pseudofrankia sp. BMG5.36]
MTITTPSATTPSAAQAAAVSPRAEAAAGAARPAVGEPALAGGQTSWPRRTAATAGPPVAVFAAFCGLWYLVSYVALTPRRRFLLPPLHEVIRVGFLDWGNFSDILRGLGNTTQVALSGFAIASAVGFTVAVLMAQTRWVERSIYPYAVALQTLPVLAMTPLVGLWFGFGLTSRILICSVLSLFPIITNTLFGLQSVEPSQRDLFALMKAGRLARLWRLELPAALPGILTGLRTSGGLAVIGAIVADFFFRQGQPGIGRLLDIYRNALETERLYAAIFCSSLLGLALFLLNTAVTKYVLRNWHASAQRKPS